jgi:hypothetical protein
VDSSCLPALLDVARPALPPELVGRLLQWEELDDAERLRARADLELMAGLMRMAAVPG